MRKVIEITEEFLSIHAVKRFWANAKKTNTCWLWTGYKTNGYGRMMVNKKSILSTRLSHFFTLFRQIHK